MATQTAPIDSAGQPVTAGESSSPTSAKTDGKASATESNSGTARPRPRPNHEIYLSPLPIRTFPLPTFYPTNPVSWAQLLYAWLCQTLRPPPKEPSVVYDGVWDAGTGSVHVRDPKAVRGLWESGFFGKGTLSRSEPNWLKRELNRKGAAAQVIEQVTMSRREERQKMKWERARSEQEALEQTRLSENAASIEGSESVSEASELLAPVGPFELLALPNSFADLVVAKPNGSVPNGNPLSVTGPKEFLAVPMPESNPLAHLMNGDVDGQGCANSPKMTGTYVNGLPNGASACDGAQPEPEATGLNGTSTSRDESIVAMLRATLAPSANGCPVTPRKEKDQESEIQSLKRQKSVRFSPKVESTTFQHFDPPSPHEALKPLQPLTNGAALGAASIDQSSGPFGDRPSPSQDMSFDEVPDKEHLQLSPEEAFFLSFSLGAINVVDPVTNAKVSTAELLVLCRSHSYFPPKHADLRPDDPFLISYCVFHHFRSLGWIVRHGIKFGADWLLYQRGPIFDHAEFAIVVVPAYSSPQWKEYEHKPPVIPWNLLMGTTRVLSHVLKSLVLVYVDVPPPPVFDAALGDPKGGIGAALACYSVREVSVRKWSANRNR